MQGSLFEVSDAYPLAQGIFLQRQFFKFAVIKFYHGVSHHKPSLQTASTCQLAGHTKAIGLVVMMLSAKHHMLSNTIHRSTA